MTLNLPDVNWDYLVGSSPFSNDFCGFIFDNNLVQLVCGPTHNLGNTLDLVLTNVPHLIDNVSIESHGLSEMCDHFVAFLLWLDTMIMSHALTIFIISHKLTMMDFCHIYFSMTSLVFIIVLILSLHIWNFLQLFTRLLTGLCQVLKQEGTNHQNGLLQRSVISRIFSVLLAKDVISSRFLLINVSSLNLFSKAKYLMLRSSLRLMLYLTFKGPTRTRYMIISQR